MNSDTASFSPGEHVSVLLQKLGASVRVAAARMAREVPGERGQPTGGAGRTAR
jgi:hypothetical protein